MGLETALIASAVIGAAGSLGSAALNKPEKPDAPPKPKDVAQRSRDAQARLKRKQAGSSGRSDTILTSPLGLVGQGSGAPKTLLGS